MSYDFNILTERDITDLASVQDERTAQQDTTWIDVPVQEPEGLERVMLSEDRLFVVLAVVLIIWIGIALLILRTDRKLDRLEQRMREPAPDATHSD